MSKEHERYVAQLISTDGAASDQIYADLTQAQANRIASWLNLQKKDGAIKDFYLGPPLKMEYIQTFFFTAPGLKRQLESVIDDLTPRLGEKA